MSAETFTFNTGGKDYTIVSYKHIPIGALRKALDEEDRIKQTFIILERTVKDKKTLEAIEEMGVEEFTNFVSAWSDNAGEGADLGDS